MALLSGIRAGRSGQRGFALLLVLFLLSGIAAAALLVVSNGLATRKLTRAVSRSVALRQRVELITWAAIDDFRRPASGSTPNQTRRDIDGFSMVAERSLESGKIDLNGLSRQELSKAIANLGFSERRAAEAADRIAVWRGMDPPGAGGLDLTVHGRTALWSLDDLYAIPGLDGEIRDSLLGFGTVYARGIYSGNDLSKTQSASLVTDGINATVISGSIVRIVATDESTGRHFRSILMFRGLGHAASGASSPWLPLEWIKPADGLK